MKFLHVILRITAIAYIALLVLRACGSVSWDIRDINALLGFHVLVRILLVEDQHYRLRIKS